MDKSSLLLQLTMQSPMLQLKAAKVFVNECLKDKEPWQIVTVTASTVLAGVWTYQFLFHPQESKCFHFQGLRV